MTDARRVLLVDDSTTTCVVVAKLLRECGFENIEVVHDGQAALGCMRDSKFEIILCDWEMAPMSGVDVLNEIRRNTETKRPSFILMSAKKELEWILAAKKAGADSMITKPFNAKVLKAKISQLGKRI
jgi:two-component system, chemotaxis family, chemotaxis protein CheY